MNFNKKLRIDYACGADKLRPAMQLIHFENGYIYATNGHIAVKNKLSECSSLSDDQIEKLNGKNLHKDLFKEILKYDIIEIDDNGIKAKKDNNIIYCEFTEVEYPDVESVIQKSLNAPIEQKQKIAINLKNLELLQKSLFNGNDSVLEFKQGNGAIIVRPKTESESMGIIMPLYLD